MALPALVAPSFAVAALKESVSLCQSILEYKHKTQQVNVQREQMHRQADFAMHQLEQNYHRNIMHLEGVFNTHTATIQALKDKNTQDYQIIACSQQQIDKCFEAICDAATPEPIKIALSHSLTLLSQNQSAVLNEFMKNTSSITNAHIATLDSLRDYGQPHTFTDVS